MKMTLIGSVKSNKMVLHIVRVISLRLKVKNSFVSSFIFLDVCRFYFSSVFPKITTERSDEKLTAERITIRRDSGASVHFTCRLTSLPDSSLIPKWEFSPENDKFHDLPSGILVQDNDLIIKPVENQHRGYYQCSFENRNGTSKVLLRMKSKNENVDETI